MNIKVGMKRLEKVADLMENFPKEYKLNMSMFCEHSVNGKPLCGTAACVAGWAATIPSLRKAGYKLDDNGDPIYKEEWGFRALEEFFALDHKDCHYIFGTTTPFGLAQSNSPNMAARRIRKIIKKYMS
jgi:hypothetical protein